MKPSRSHYTRLYYNVGDVFTSWLFCILLLFPRSQLLDKTQYTVIHDSEDSHGLECELDKALENGYQLIVIEPVGLGDRAIRWIRVGNFLHKSTVLSSLGVLVVGPFLSPKTAVWSLLPLGVVGVLCACVYDFSWQFDPCCKYQVDYKGRGLTRVPSQELESQSPVVLVQKNDKHRKVLHNFLAIFTTCVIGYKLYKYLY